MDIRERLGHGCPRATAGRAAEKVPPTMAEYYLSRQISIYLIQQPTVIQSKC